MLRWTQAFQAVPQCFDRSALRRDARLARCGWRACWPERKTTLYGIEGYTALLVNGKELESRRPRQRNGMGTGPDKVVMKA